MTTCVNCGELLNDGDVFVGAFGRNEISHLGCAVRRIETTQVKLDYLRSLRTAVRQMLVPDDEAVRELQ